MPLKRKRKSPRLNPPRIIRLESGTRLAAEESSEQYFKRHKSFLENARSQESIPEAYIVENNGSLTIQCRFCGNHMAMASLPPLQMSASGGGEAKSVERSDAAVQVSLPPQPLLLLTGNGDRSAAGRAFLTDTRPSSCSSLSAPAGTLAVTEALTCGSQWDATTVRSTTHIVISSSSASSASSSRSSSPHPHSSWRNSEAPAVSTQVCCLNVDGAPEANIADDDGSDPSGVLERSRRDANAKDVLDAMDLNDVTKEVNPVTEEFNQVSVSSAATSSAFPPPTSPPTLQIIPPKPGTAPPQPRPSSPPNLTFILALEEVEDETTPPGLIAPLSPRLAEEEEEESRGTEASTETRTGLLFECSVCHKDFKDKHRLSIHFKTHRREKLHKCELCDRAYTKANIADDDGSDPSGVLERSRRDANAKDVLDAMDLNDVTKEVNPVTEEVNQVSVSSAATSSAFPPATSPPTLQIIPPKLGTAPPQPRPSSPPNLTFILALEEVEDETTPPGLIAPLKTRTGLLFECSVCHKDFKDKHRLSIHFKTHRREKLHKCELCDRAYTKANIADDDGSDPSGVLERSRRDANAKDVLDAMDLNDVTKEVNPVTEEVNQIIPPKPGTAPPQPRPSSPPNLTFILALEEVEDETTPPGLIAPLKTRTGLLFGCSLCHEDFKDKHRLSIHFKMHKREKLHKCELCDRAYTKANIADDDGSDPSGVLERSRRDANAKDVLYAMDLNDVTKEVNPVSVSSAATSSAFPPATSPPTLQIIPPKPGTAPPQPRPSSPSNLRTCVFLEEVGHETTPPGLIAPLSPQLAEEESRGTGAESLKAPNHCPSPRKAATEAGGTANSAAVGDPGAAVVSEEASYAPADYKQAGQDNIDTDMSASWDGEANVADIANGSAVGFKAAGEAPAVSTQVGWDNADGAPEANIANDDGSDPSSVLERSRRDFNTNGVLDAMDLNDVTKVNQVNGKSAFPPATSPTLHTTPPQPRTAWPRLRIFPVQPKTTSPLARTGPPLARTTPPRTRTTIPLARTAPPLARTAPPQPRPSSPPNLRTCIFALEEVVDVTTPSGLIPPRSPRLAEESRGTGAGAAVGFEKAHNSPADYKQAGQDNIDTDMSASWDGGANVADIAKAAVGLEEANYAPADSKQAGCDIDSGGEANVANIANSSAVGFKAAGDAPAVSTQVGCDNVEGAPEANFANDVGPDSPSVLEWLGRNFNANDVLHTTLPQPWAALPQHRTAPPQPRTAPPLARPFSPPNLRTCIFALEEVVAETTPRNFNANDVLHTTPPQPRAALPQPRAALPQPRTAPPQPRTAPPQPRTAPPLARPFSPPNLRTCIFALEEVVDETTPRNFNANDVLHTTPPQPRAAPPQPRATPPQPRTAPPLARPFSPPNLRTCIFDLEEVVDETTPRNFDANDVLHTTPPQPRAAPPQPRTAPPLARPFSPPNLRTCIFALEEVVDETTPPGLIGPLSPRPEAEEEESRGTGAGEFNLSY
ncbi:hypothetical protein NHX12_021468 [Muraenolepis orangiensis]|uniref:C2H2-type domain-containing protein n=1 Tax=Muraenolepis orangiensis TaxID=630683 RepID=A0A9Q0ES72_9TELE|nr:hypothetical protein NHX12_021468 [Muraenolepis orangiensis]